MQLVDLLEGGETSAEVEEAVAELKSSWEKKDNKERGGGK